MIALAKTKLNLGSRDRALAGFTNYDCDKHEGVDVVGDIRNLSAFGDGSVSVIYASHVAEHVPHVETMAMLKEWCRVLEPGGVLYIAVPDFARTVEIYGKIGLQDWVVNYLMGDQIYKTAFHYNIFDEDRLRSLLKEAGFSEVSRVESFGMHPTDCSNGKSNYDAKSVSLNMVAVKE